MSINESRTSRVLLSRSDEVSLGFSGSYEATITSSYIEGEGDCEDEEKEADD